MIEPVMIMVLTLPNNEGKHVRQSGKCGYRLVYGVKKLLLIVFSVEVVLWIHLNMNIL